MEVIYRATTNQGWNQHDRLEHHQFPVKLLLRFRPPALARVSLLTSLRTGETQDIQDDTQLPEEATAQSYPEAIAEDDPHATTDRMSGPSTDADEENFHTCQS